MSVVLSVGVCILVVLQATNGCPNFWTTFEGSCYVVLETTVSWPEGAEICERFDSHLAIIETATENAFIKSYLQSKKLRVTHVWIGGNDLLNEGHWVWEDTQANMTYTDWCPGEPDDLHDQDCVSVTVSSSASFHCVNWQWDDEACSRKYSVLCEQSDRSNVVIG